MSHAPPGVAKRSRPTRRRWVRVAIVVGSVFAVLAVVGGASAYILYSKFGQITVIEAPTTALPAQGADQPDPPLNILLMGSDSRTGKGNDKYGLDSGRGGERSDTTILLHVSSDRQRALAVSIPRDLWVEQPECALAEGQYPYYAKFNNAFEIGGAACTTELVQQLTGVPVHHIAVVDFQGFKQVVDALGGVEVCLNNPVYDPAAKLELPAGTSLVQGEDALAFVRARKSLGDGSDIGRIERQQAFLSSAIRKATDTGLLLNPAKMYSVLDTATKALTVDQSLDELSEMRSLAESMRTITPNKITFVTLPFVYRADGANVDPDPVKAAALWQSMIDDTPWPPPPSVGPDGRKLTVAPGDIWLDVKAPTRSLDDTVALLQAGGFGVGEQSTGGSGATTRVVYPPGQEEAARTVAHATGAVMVADSGAWGVRLEVGRDFPETLDAVVIGRSKKNPPAEPEGSEAGSVHKADEVVCAG